MYGLYNYIIKKNLFRCALCMWVCCSDFPLNFLMNRVFLNAQCCFRFAVRFLTKLCQCNYYCIELTAHSHTCSYTLKNPTQLNSFFSFYLNSKYSPIKYTVVSFTESIVNHSKVRFCFLSSSDKYTITQSHREKREWKTLANTNASYT